MTPSKLRVLTTIRSMQQGGHDVTLHEIAKRCRVSVPYVHKVTKWAIKSGLIYARKNKDIYDFTEFDKVVT